VEATALLAKLDQIYNGPWDNPLVEDECIDLGEEKGNYDNAQGENQDIMDAHAILISQSYMRDW